MGAQKTTINTIVAFAKILTLLILPWSAPLVLICTMALKSPRFRPFLCKDWVLALKAGSDLAFTLLRMKTLWELLSIEVKVLAPLSLNAELICKIVKIWELGMLRIKLNGRTKLSNLVLVNIHLGLEILASKNGFWKMLENWEFQLYIWLVALLMVRSTCLELTSMSKVIALSMAMLSAGICVLDDHHKCYKKIFKFVLYHKFFMARVLLLLVYLKNKFMKHQFYFDISL